ncbi:hypothetical protein B296_00015642 [Ensete ventricosum]|uniref:Uncharacterized protein n=1 Tax=Ensete ventricosum TaxID=4639 RepID=A0A426ZM31_ENSVE|nr:hypothetical protein B296_00015642 [Ensete ventricosum]
MSRGSCRVACAVLPRVPHVTQRRPLPLSEAARGATSRRGNSPPLCAGCCRRRRPRGLPPALAAMQAAAYDGGHAGRGLANRRLATRLLATVQSGCQRCGPLPVVGWPPARAGQLAQVAGCCTDSWPSELLSHCASCPFCWLNHFAATLARESIFRN